MSCNSFHEPLSDWKNSSQMSVLCTQQEWILQSITKTVPPHPWPYVWPTCSCGWQESVSWCTKLLRSQLTMTAVLHKITFAPVNLEPRFIIQNAAKHHQQEAVQRHCGNPPSNQSLENICQTTCRVKPQKCDSLTGRRTTKLSVALCIPCHDHDQTWLLLNRNTCKLYHKDLDLFIPLN